MTPRSARRRLLPATLRARITLLAALAVLGVLTVVSVGLVVAQRAALVEALDESLDQHADMVAADLRSGQGVRRRDLSSEDVVIEVIAPDGTLLAASEDLTGRLPRSAEQDDGEITDVELPGGRGSARLLVREFDGTTVVVAASLDDVSDSVGALAGTLVVAVPLTGAVLAGIVWWAVGRALRPVEDIRSRVDLISGTRLDRRVPEPATPREIGRLARTMNAMLGRLQASAEQQRRFVADASHELRSPLARIRAELEVDAAHPESADLPATHRSVLGEAVILQRLVDDLLLLARGDAGALDVVRAGPVDLDDVVERAAVVRRGDGRARIDTQGVTPVQVSGDEAQLGRAVGNLLDNAVRHARGAVTVTLADTSGHAVLTVSDDGPGIPAEERDRVFERFTRVDEARSGDGGVGLGLAIARDIAVRHGGGLRLDTTAPSGARLVFTLPGDGVSGPDGPGRA